MVFRWGEKRANDWSGFSSLGLQDWASNATQGLSTLGYSLLADEMIWQFSNFPPSAPPSLHASCSTETNRLSPSDSILSHTSSTSISLEQGLSGFRGSIYSGSPLVFMDRPDDLIEASSYRGKVEEPKEDENKASLTTAFNFINTHSYEYRPRDGQLKLGRRQPSPVRQVCLPASSNRQPTPSSILHGRVETSGVEETDPSQVSPLSLTPPSAISTPPTERGLDAKKARIVDGVVIHLKNKIKDVFALARGCYRQVPVSAGGGESSEPALRMANAANPAPRSGKKRWASDKDFNSDRDDNEGRSGRKIPGSKEGEEGTVAYACPYFKYNPGMYKSARNCPGPGWLSVHRVKWVVITLWFGVGLLITDHRH